MATRVVSDVEEVVEVEGSIVMRRTRVTERTVPSERVHRLVTAQAAVVASLETQKTAAEEKLAQLTEMQALLPPPEPEGEKPPTDEEKPVGDTPLEQVTGEG